MYLIEILRDTVVNRQPALKGSSIEVDLATALLLVNTGKGEYKGDPCDLDPEPVQTITNEAAERSGQYVNQPDDSATRRRKARGEAPAPVEE